MKLEEIKQYEIIEEKIRERASDICDYIIKKLMNLIRNIQK